MAAWLSIQVGAGAKSPCRCAANSAAVAKRSAGSKRPCDWRPTSPAAANTSPDWSTIKRARSTGRVPRLPDSASALPGFSLPRQAISGIRLLSAFHRAMIASGPSRSTKPPTPPILSSGRCASPLSWYSPLKSLKVTPYRAEESYVTVAIVVVCTSVRINRIRVISIWGHVEKPTDCVSGIRRRHAGHVRGGRG